MGSTLLPSSLLQVSIDEASAAGVCGNLIIKDMEYPTTGMIAVPSRVEEASMAEKTDQIKEIEVARGFWSRFRGWIGRIPLPGTALLIYPCSSVHTFFMRVSIDVVFLNPDGRVIMIIEGLRPWRISPFVSQAAAVLELLEGEARKSGIKEGDMLPSPVAELVLNYFV